MRTVISKKVTALWNPDWDLLTDYEDEKRKQIVRERGGLRSDPFRKKDEYNLPDKTKNIGEYGQDPGLGQNRRKPPIGEPGISSLTRGEEPEERSGTDVSSGPASDSMRSEENETNLRPNRMNPNDVSRQFANESETVPPELKTPGYTNPRDMSPKDRVRWHLDNMRQRGPVRYR